MYLISYDITSDRLRTKVSDVLLDYGTRVQFSVFECDIDAKRFRELYKKLMEIVFEASEVSIRIYPMDADQIGRRIVIGESEAQEDNDDFAVFV